MIMSPDGVAKLINVNVKCPIKSIQKVGRNRILYLIIDNKVKEKNMIN